MFTKIIKENIVNIIEQTVLLNLVNNGFQNQRELAKRTNYSVGAVNNAIKSLINNKMITDNKELTQKAKKELKKNKPERAIILAAGFGTRMVPINANKPKGLIEIQGETLIERTIKQLKEKHITEIYVVVGFMKEQYEFLIDKYNINLVVNEDYKTKNNLFSVSRVLDKIQNSYIIPCDLYCKENPFNENEWFSWYMISNKTDSNSNIRVNRKNELVESNNAAGNRMVGIAYINKDDSTNIKKAIKDLCSKSNNSECFWEDAITNHKKMMIDARIVEDDSIVEINTYEQLRDLDYQSPQLKDEVIETISKCFSVDTRDINNINVLKKGMTNRSFTFECKGKKYIMRVPGEGTDQLIDRKKESEVYNAIKGKGICDNIVYINPKNGLKITEYINNPRECNPDNNNDLKKCMARLKQIHNMNLKVSHRFEVFKEIEKYEKLRNRDSIYPDYQTTKNNIKSLKTFINNHKEKDVLAHIDSVPDNFLFSKNEKGEEDLHLIDWEYAGMQDPHIDIAMFCIYALYDRKRVDKLINLYFEGKCPDVTRMKIYCYIAVCGLLWSNWCEYKSLFGIEFGEYSLRQYRYAKEYYRIYKEEYLETINE